MTRVLTILPSLEKMQTFCRFLSITKACVIVKFFLMHSGYLLPEHLFDFQWNNPTLDSLWLEVTSFPFRGHRFSFLVLTIEVSFPSPCFILVLGCCLLKVHYFIGLHTPRKLPFPGNLDKVPQYYEGKPRLSALISTFAKWVYSSCSGTFRSYMGTEGKGQIDSWENVLLCS